MNNPAAAVGMWREILLRLPAVSLLRFRSVCKGWCSVIDDPGFIKAHTTQEEQLVRSTTLIIRNSTGPPFSPLYYVDFEDLDFTSCGLQTIPATPLKLTRRGLLRLEAFPVPACNGLLLIAPLRTTTYGIQYYDSGPGGTWEIMNPLTEESLKLPQPTNINDSDRIQGIGLGYDSAADDYKVVVIHGEYYKQTHVYSLRSDTWRTIGSYPFDGTQNPYGVFLSGALHWVSDDRIIVFDVRTESYRQLALPTSFDREPMILMWLEVFGGCLFLICQVDRGSWVMDFWAMNDYGGKYTWTKLFELGESTFMPVAYMKNKRPQVLLRRSSDGEFFLFDVESKTRKRIATHGIYFEHCSAQVCVGSLFRLHDSCGRRRVAAPPSKTIRNLKTAARTKLTFCLRYLSHDNCHCDSCPNRIKVCETSTFGGDSSASTLISLDLWREIFLRFPAKSMSQFRAVCMDWKAVIDDPCFLKAHTNTNTTVLIQIKTGTLFHSFYSFDLDELDFTKALQKITVTPHESTGLTTKIPCLPVVSECNGLMLVDDNEKLQLWNPLTDERLELPQIEGFINSNPIKRVATGFGYEESTNDYKVVVVHSWEGEEKVIMYRTHVYSLRWDSWKMIAAGDDDDDKCRPDGPGIFLCGALHWLSESSYEITVLDLVTERYRQILQGPPLGRGWDYGDEHSCLGVLDGCLIVNDWGESNDFGEFYDVWVMKKDYGSDDSWFKLIAIQETSTSKRKFLGGADELRALTYVKNKTQILLGNENGFYLHDVGSDSMKNVICIHGLDRNSSSQIFSGTIFRLHDNCGVGGKRRERKRKSNTRPADTELYLCVRDIVVDPADYYYYDYYSHDGCYTVDSNWYCSSSENED